MTTQLPSLLLMRHAKSSWKHAELVDHDRPLNRRGERAARDMAIFLQRQSIIPARVLCSSAIRALQTAQTLVAEFDIPEIQVQPQLYEAGPAVWKELLAELPASTVTLIVGHNPALEELVSEIAGEPVTFPTAAIAVCSAKPGWDSFQFDQLQLEKLWRPREVVMD